MGAPSAEKFAGWLFSRLIEQDLFEYIPRDNIRLIAERTSQFFYRDGVLEGGELAKWFTGEYGLSDDKALAFLTLIKKEAKNLGVTVLMPGEKAPPRKTPENQIEKSASPPAPAAPPIRPPAPAKAKAASSRAKKKAAPPKPKAAGRPPADAAADQQPVGLNAFARAHPLRFFGGLVLAVVLTVILVKVLNPAKVRKVEIDVSPAGISAVSTKATGEMLIVVVESKDWESLTPEEREKAVGDLYDIAKRSGFDELQVKSSAGRLLAQVGSREAIVWF